MANWNNPTVNSNYVTFVDEVKNRDVDAARMFDGTGDNLPNLTIRWNQSNQRFERLQDGTWSARTLSVGGGGTGATTAAGARSSLELGSMALQSSNNVSIAGGSINGVAFTGTGTLTGNASTASTWQTARTLTIGATGKSVNGSAAVTWTAAEIGTPNNTANTLVARNASGNFNAGTITATFSGNGSNITALNASNLTTGTVPDARLGATQTISLGGQFTTDNTLLLSKTGRVVTATLLATAHTSASLRDSATSLIPAEWLPSQNLFFSTSQYGRDSFGDPTYTKQATQRIEFSASFNRIRISYYDDTAGTSANRTLTFPTSFSWITAS
jgi:hypothetical protein